MLHDDPIDSVAGPPMGARGLPRPAPTRPDLLRLARTARFGRVARIRGPVGIRAPRRCPEPGGLRTPPPLSAAQPPARHSYRFTRDWDYLRDALA